MKSISVKTPDGGQSPSEATTYWEHNKHLKTRAEKEFGFHSELVSFKAINPLKLGNYFTYQPD